MEDDIVLHDPWLFTEPAWFTKSAEYASLLQPFRFDVPPVGQVRRGDSGGPVPIEVTARDQNGREHPAIKATFWDTSIACHRATNPHAGCCFLNAAQMHGQAA